jgi:hypothetical protein
MADKHAGGAGGADEKGRLAVIRELLGRRRDAQAEADRLNAQLIEMLGLNGGDYLATVEEVPDQWTCLIKRQYYDGHRCVLIHGRRYATGSIAEARAMYAEWVAESLSGYDDIDHPF